MKKEIYIYGHKNPDTDSICAALSLANLKNEMAKAQQADNTKYWGKVDKEKNYVAMAAGEPNSETAYVLERFGVKAPKVATDIRRQISDITIKDVVSVSADTTLKRAWEIMHEEKTYTVPVKDDKDNMLGILTIGDMARAYMDVFNNTAITDAGATYANIAEVLEGKIIVGDANQVVSGGKVNVATATTELIDTNIEKGDIAILSDDEESQIFLVEKGVACLIITHGFEPSEKVRQIVAEKGVVLIATEIGTHRVARLINQGLSAKYLMRPMDEVCSFNIDQYIDDVKAVISEKRFRDFPVCDGEGNFVGMINKSSLINMDSKQVILVDHNEMNQAVLGLFDADVVEIVDHHKLGTVETLQPISVTNKPVGCTSTIIYQMYKENGIEITNQVAGLLCSAILSDTMLFKSPTCTDEDVKAAKALASDANIDLDDLWQSMLRASLDLDSKTEKEIFYQDYKQFEAQGFTFGAGQVLAANEEDVKIVKDRMLPYLETALADEKIDMVCLMITNVSDESTELIYAGANAQGVLESAFETKSADGGVYLEGVVSRKKQLIPPIMAVLQ